REAERSFSYLYTANVAGAVAGTTLPLLLIELLGFHGTLRVGAASNGLIAVAAIVFSLPRSPKESAAAPPQPAEKAAYGAASSGTLLVLLFITGLTSMGMEVVWIRQFTPYLGTVVYAFASILGTYLVSTFIGLQVYRLWSRENRREGILVWGLLAFFALLPLLAANPHIHLFPLLRLFAGIAPFSGVLGFVTPLLVDRW